MLLGIVAIVSGTRAYHKHVAKGVGYLGEEVVYFDENEKDMSATLEEDLGLSSPEPSTKGATGDLLASSEPEGDSTAEPSASQEPSEGDSTAEPSASQEPSKENSSSESYDKIISHGKIKLYDSGTVVIGNAGYELYSYVDSTAKRYAVVVDKLTKKVGDKADVYTMIAPTSVGITLPDNKKDKVNSSSQDKALKKIQKKLSGKEIFVPLYDTMMRHRTEYIYFRTDHHWTSLGAYYAYEAFCQKKGIQANPISSYKKKTAKGFLGTFYSDTDQNKSLKKDTLESYYPLSHKLTMKYTTVDGTTAKAPVIADATNYGTSLKYCAYIAGDNPYTVIQNKEIKDGTSCVVVKESYGNAFVPYLADHYQTIYVIDYRYWEGNLPDFIEKKSIKDVILINNISMTRNAYLVGKMAQIVS